MTRAYQIVLVALILIWPSERSLADELSATRGQALRESAHTVDITLTDGLATYRVRRSFHNGGSLAEEAALAISLPHGAVATGLRIKSGARWYSGDLMHRDKAEELYRELTGLGPSQPKDPALLYWVWTDHLVLRVFPIFPGRRSTIEYTLTVPTAYRDGVYYLSYPRKASAKNLAPPVLRIHHSGGATVFVDGVKARASRIALNNMPLDPILVEHGITNDRVLVRSLEVAATEHTEMVEIEVDIQHTWSGDLQLDLIDPTGMLHEIQAYDLDNSGNALKTKLVVPVAATQASGRWHLLVTDHHPLDGGTLLSWSLRPFQGAQSPTGPRVADQRPVFIPQPSDGDSGTATLGIAPHSEASSQVRLGRVALLPDKQFSRVEIDLAKRLSKAPNKLSVVFVIDASHTMGEHGIEEQLRLVRAYLSHVPDARFALIGTHRHTELWSNFAPARRFDDIQSSLQASGRLVAKNGSFLDRGFAAAVQLLHDVRGPSAVVALTDNRLRPVWSDASSIAAIDDLPRSSVVHFVELRDDDELKLQRSDAHQLYPLAWKRGGIAVIARGITGSKWQRLREEITYLVRPDRLDHPRLDTIDDLNIFNGDSMREGSSVRWMAQVALAPSSLTLRGQLWSRSVEFSAGKDEAFHRATAGFVFSLDHYGELSDPEQFVLAIYAGAVSPVTSYLAIEPGVRPSTIGFVGRSASVFGAGGLGLVGTGRGGGGASNE